LSARIAAPAGFFTLVSVAALSVLQIRSQREQTLQEAIHGSENIAEIIQLSLHHEMAINRRDELTEMLLSVGAQLDLETVRIYNKDGVISFSSRESEVGQAVDIASDACAACHQGPVPLSEIAHDNRSRVYVDPSGERVLGTILVIENEEGCQGSGCHASTADRSVLGIMDVTVSLAPHQARVAEATRNAVLFSLLAVMFITGTLYLMITHSVRQPIDAMVAATRRVAAGGATLPVPRGASREIGILASSFNELVENLSSSQFKTAALASSLEEKVTDIARELRDAQFQVAHAEKLSSVGLVAAGIAHELNSPLMAIITFTHLVKGALPDDAPEQADLQMIEREANRCASIIRQLLDYSRKQAQEPDTEPCDISGIVSRAVDLLKIEIQNGNVEVQISVPTPLPQVEANEVQLMQVFLNLILNAIHAMPTGGRLTIHAEVVDRAEHLQDDLPPHRSDKLLKTIVRDTGTGIPPESIHKVFDPFFTTKPVGKGSGLGLSVSQGLIRGYRGTILVDSDGHSGTQFTVLLPVPEALGEEIEP
jgi:two-component system NtrC family sensor kinase